MRKLMISTALGLSLLLAPALAFAQTGPNGMNASGNNNQPNAYSCNNTAGASGTAAPGVNAGITGANGSAAQEANAGATGTSGTAAQGGTPGTTGTAAQHCGYRR